MVNFCPTCGVRVRPADKYCGTCMVKLPEVESPPSGTGAADSSPASEASGEPSPTSGPEPEVAPLPLPEIPSSEPTQEGIVEALRRCFGEPVRGRELDDWIRLLTFRSRDETFLVTAGLAPFGHELAVRVPEPVEALPDWAEALVIDLVDTVKDVRRGFTLGTERDSPVPIPGLPGIVLLEDPLCSPLQVGQARVPVFIACGLTAEETDRWNHRILRKRLLGVLPTLATVASRPTSPALPAPGELSVPPWATPVTRAWMRIEHWMAEQFMGANELLGSPAKEDAIASLEAGLGARLPEAIRESWMRHDGEGEVIRLMSPWRLLSLEDMAAEWDELGEDPDEGTAGWLPLMTDDEGGYICVRLGLPGRPAPEGVFRFGFGRRRHTRVADGWAEFLDGFARRLDAGDFQLDLDGTMLEVDSEESEEGSPSRFELPSSPEPEDVEELFQEALAGRVSPAQLFPWLAAHVPGFLTEFEHPTRPDAPPPARLFLSGPEGSAAALYTHRDLADSLLDEEEADRLREYPALSCLQWLIRGGMRQVLLNPGAGDLPLSPTLMLLLFREYALVELKRAGGAWVPVRDGKPGVVEVKPGASSLPIYLSEEDARDIAARGDSGAELHPWSRIHAWCVEAGVDGVFLQWGHPEQAGIRRPVVARLAGAPMEPLEEVEQLLARSRGLLTPVELWPVLARLDRIWALTDADGDVVRLGDTLDFFTSLEAAVWFLKQPRSQGEATTAMPRFLPAPPLFQWVAEKGRTISINRGSEFFWVDALGGLPALIKTASAEAKPGPKPAPVPVEPESKPATPTEEKPRGSWFQRLRARFQGSSKQEETPAPEAPPPARPEGAGALKQLSTRGCARQGHPEFVLEFAPETLDVDVDWLREFLETAVARGERFREGETFQIGWCITKVVALPDGRLTLHEPDFEAIPARFTPGVSRTLRHLRLQKDVADSVGLLDALAFPSPGLAALVCTRLASARRIWMDRADPASGENSGWFIGCSGENHDHQTPSSLARKTLYQIAVEQPSVLPYLALPERTQVVVPGRSVLEEEGFSAALDRAELWHDEVPLSVRPGSLLETARRRRPPRSA